MKGRLLSTNVHDPLSRAMHIPSIIICLKSVLAIGGDSIDSVLRMTHTIRAGGRIVTLPLSKKTLRLLNVRKLPGTCRQDPLSKAICLEPWIGRHRHDAHWLSHPSQLSALFQDALRRLNHRLDAVMLDARGYEAHAFLAVLPLLEKYRPYLLLRFSDAQLRQHTFCSNFLLQWCKSLGYELVLSNQRLPPTTVDDVIRDSEHHPKNVYTLCLQQRTAPVCLHHAPSVSPTRMSECARPFLDRPINRATWMRLRERRYLFAHFRYPRRVQPYHDERLACLRALGFQVEDFTVDWPRSDFVGQTSPPNWALFPDIRNIELAWRRGDKGAFRIYERLQKRAEKSDVLISLSGAGLHPEFVRQLKCFRVFTFFNDPESDAFSGFFAPSYDYVFTGNVNCLQMYKSWGCTNVSWLPGAVARMERDTTLTEDLICSGQRDIDTIFLGERDPHRDLMLMHILKRFPKTIVRGDRWPGGFISNPEAVRLYQRSRISWSIDQSVGPTSNRNFRVPANGVLLIGHNRSGLDQLYRLGEEAIGFDTVDECIDYTRYYLDNEHERRRIAANGWKRAIRDYTFEGSWNRLLNCIAPYLQP